VTIIAGTLTLCVEEVEHGDNDGVSTEHVVPTRSHALQRHPKPSADQQRPVQLSPKVIICLKQHMKLGDYIPMAWRCTSQGSHFVIHCYHYRDTIY